MYVGFAYFTPESPAAGVERHLWFILSDPARSSRVVTANVSSKKCPSGEVCVVSPQEHDKVSRESYLRFREVRVVDLANLERLLKAGTLSQTTDASATLVLKLRAAALGSRAVPKEVQEILKAQGTASSEA